LNSEEKDLLKRLKEGDRAAFARLVEEYSPRIYGQALRMMQDPAEAEEILQETFLQVVRHIESFRGQSQLGTWLYRIATNQALMRLRRKRLASLPLDEAGQDGLETALPSADWSKRPEAELLDQEAREEMERAIAELPDSLRVVFLMRDVEGLSTAETAEALDLSISAVKSRLLRARMKLRNELSAYFSERISEGEMT
jgi:RNA polymerase sigma-70 factor (ECF subfamily)